VKKLSVVILLLICACSGNEDKTEQQSYPQTKDKTAETQTRKSQNTTQSKTTSAYSFKIIGSSGNFGYQILDATGKMVINQPNIPAIQGIKGFSSESDARKAAEFVIQKIDNGHFPPTFTVAELDSLRIVH
jgi:hypothetical protein